MSNSNPNQFPVLGPDNAPTGPTSSPRQLTAEESALVNGSSEEWFYLQVTYTDEDKNKPAKQGYISQYTAGAMYWDSYIIITDTPQTKFKSNKSGEWESDVKNITYKNPPFFLCVTAAPRYWVYLSNYYTKVKWWIDNGQLHNDYVNGPAGFDPQHPPFYSRELWVGYHNKNLLSECKKIQC